MYIFDYITGYHWSIDWLIYILAGFLWLYPATKVIKWLADKDPLTRATKGFVSAINWMKEKDMTSKTNMFWENTKRYDNLRNENVLEVFPELKEFYDHYEKNKA